MAPPTHLLSLNSELAEGRKSLRQSHDVALRRRGRPLGGGGRLARAVGRGEGGQAEERVRQKGQQLPLLPVSIRAGM